MQLTDKPIAIDLFAGAGGLSGGFTRAGFTVKAALEHIAVFSKTHQLNFPDCTTITADISKLSPQDFARAALIKRGEVDVVIGGPPCQTFSTIGAPKIRSLSKNDARSDPRNYLFKYFAEYVKYFCPSVFVLENVPTMRTKYDGHLFERLTTLLSDLGYSLNVSVLNAVEYGVPQQRRRLFIVGWRNQRSYSFPAATHSIQDGAQRSLLHFDRKSANTVYDAIGDLPEIYDGCRQDELEYSRHVNLTPYQRAMRNSHGKVRNNICRISNDRAKRVFSRMREGQRYMDLPASVRRILPFREDIFHDRLKRLVYEQPSWTVLAHIGIDGYMYIHPSEHRTLSVREAARIQAFHDSFVFVGNMREQYIQVGNAVPPLLAQKVASSVLEAM